MSMRKILAGVFAVAAAMTTVAAVAAEQNAVAAPSSVHKWWQPGPDAFQFQVQKQNQALVQQGFDPYSP
jgi:hypothetical protein